MTGPDLGAVARIDSRPAVVGFDRRTPVSRS
jgi:hypothetical protein